MEIKKNDLLSNSKDLLPTSTAKTLDLHHFEAPPPFVSPLTTLANTSAEFCHLSWQPCPSAEAFGPRSTFWCLFPLFSFRIQVLSFCYNGMLLMGGFPSLLHCSCQLLSFRVCCSHLIMQWLCPRRRSPISLSLSGLIAAKRLPRKLRETNGKQIQSTHLSY